MSQSNKYFEVSIPIRSYLKKFIAAHKSVEPFELKPHKCHFTALFMEPAKKGYIRKEVESDDLLNDRIILRMPPSIIKENKFTFDENTIAAIDDKLYQMFKQQMIDFIVINNEKRGDILQSVIAFRDHYDIHEDDFKLETALKIFQRSKDSGSEKRKKKIKSMIYVQGSLFA